MDKKWIVNIDLDCFSLVWEDFIFPWPKEVFEKKYKQICQGVYMQNWSGERFVEFLMKKAGILLIAREPVHCGGKDKCQEILNRVNKFLFKNQLL